MKSYQFTLCVAIISSPANAAYINSDIFGEYIEFNDHITVASGAQIYADTVHFGQSLYLNNYGTISGNITICDGCDAYIENSGVINGDIIAGKDSNVTQVIRSADDVAGLNIYGGYDILVYQATDLIWTDILSASVGANKIMIANSAINISNSMMPLLRSAPPRIELIGENKINIDIDNISSDMPILSNITGNGTVNVSVDNLDPIYAAQAVIKSGSLYLNLVRETDYYKIMRNEQGVFLNSLRLSNPNDKLLHALDNATSIDQLYSVLNKSMRMNARRLNNPIKTFNHHISNSFGTDADNLPASFTPLVIIGHDISAYGLSVALNKKVAANTVLALNGYVANMNFTDTIDDFGAIMYGTALSIRHNSNKMFVRADAGFTASKLSAPALYSGATSPNGYSAYTNIDLGPVIKRTNNFSVTPIIGVAVDYVKVTNHETDFLGRGGFITEYKYQTTDLSYSYGFEFLTQTDSMLSLSARAGIASPYDEMSGYLKVIMIRDRMGLSYSISLNMTFEF